MPARTPLEELDRRIPLSIAPWHQHTNICLPPRAQGPADRAIRLAEFGPRGMVQVNLFAGTPEEVWADAPGGMRHH